MQELQVSGTHTVHNTLSLTALHCGSYRSLKHTKFIKLLKLCSAFGNFAKAFLCQVLFREVAKADHTVHLIGQSVYNVIGMSVIVSETCIQKKKENGRRNWHDWG